MTVMNRRQLLQSALALPLTFLGLPGCSRDEPLDIGLHPWPGYEPLLLARDFGWLGEAVRLSEGHNAGDSIAGLKSGALSAAGLTLDEVLGLRVGGMPLTVVLVMNESVGADVVLARSGIQTPADIKGKRIAVEQGASGAVVLQKLLAAGGLEAADIERVNAAPSDQLPLWQSAQIDVAISYPPFSKPLMRAGAQPIFDSRQFPQTILDVLAVRTDHMYQYDETLRTLIHGHFRALDHLRTSREDGLRRIAARRNLSYEETEASFRGLNLPGLSANSSLLAASGGLEATARNLNALMTSTGLLAAPDSLVDLATADFLPDEKN